MKYIVGKKLKTQPRNLVYGYRFDDFKFFYRINNENKFENIITEINGWCNDTYGQDYVWSLTGPYHNWKYICGTRYFYYFFKSKEDAILFKMTWM